MSRSTKNSPKRSLGVKLGSAAAVVVAVLLGVWITGGLITNDFALAMGLTTAWFVFAAVACAAIAWRRRDLRVPVIGAYLVTAAVVGAYLGRSIVFSDEVDEQVVTADTAPPAQSAGQPARPANRLLARGRFRPVAHPARGVASTIRRSNGNEVLTLTSFEVDSGPDLRVYLVAGPARDEGEVKDFKDLGGLKGSRGNQQYRIPRSLDLDRYTTVVIWCRAFSVNFARAPLR